MAAKIRTKKKKKIPLKGGRLKKKSFGFSASESDTLIATQRQRRLEEMAVHLSMGVAGALLLFAGFAKFRKPWGATLTALIVYLCYIPAAILVDHKTGTFYKFLMAIAVVALLRALASAFSHRKVWRELYADEEPRSEPPEVLDSPKP